MELLFGFGSGKKNIGGKRRSHDPNHYKKETRTKNKKAEHWDASCDKKRLEKSVTMVAKVVLKEHLILLANSMTCAGNLVGFNYGGYKALTHSYNVEAPFTEATLSTPRRCFERAAEKRHMDSFSSIVASCS